MTPSTLCTGQGRTLCSPEQDNRFPLELTEEMRLTAGPNCQSRKIVPSAIAHKPIEAILKGVPPGGLYTFTPGAPEPIAINPGLGVDWLAQGLGPLHISFCNSVLNPVGPPPVPPPRLPSMFTLSDIWQKSIIDTPSVSLTNTFCPTV